MRPIDADYAKETAEVIFGDILLQRAVILLLDRIPTVDGAVMVRCRDCKHFEMNLFDGCEVCTHIHGYVRPDFGCIDGERKDNGQADKTR